MADDKKHDEMPENEIGNLLKDISDFIDYNTFNRIANKLTDYAEIISEGKIAGIINFNFRLNSNQTNLVVKLLEEIQGITRIYNLALKGSKDLEVEYISLIFSDFDNPENISSYINLKNIIENRLTHQVQQYNVNMGKSNTTMAIPLNELRGHVKSFTDLADNDLLVSTKVQHGIIAASLHDAYTTLINRSEFSSDRTYMKFFFNEDDPSKNKFLLLKKERRLPIKEIGVKLREIMEKLQTGAFSHLQYDRHASQREPMQTPDFPIRYNRSDTFIDRMMMTPFGKQYGVIIDKIITGIFDQAKRDIMRSISEESIREKTSLLFQTFKLRSDLSKFPGEVVYLADYLLMQDYGVKTFAEKFLYYDRKEIFSKFFSGQNQEHIEQFLFQAFGVYFEEIFSSLFRIIKSMDMKKFACAFIIKRIYLREGESLSNFGFFFIRVIAKIGGIRAQ